MIKNAAKDKKILVDFMKTNLRYPKNKDREAYNALMRLRYKDPEFLKKDVRKLQRSLGMVTRVKIYKTTIKKKLISWIEKNGRFPKRTSQLLTERKAAQRLANFVSPASGSFDPKFRKTLEEKFGMKAPRTKKRHNVRERFNNLMNFIQTYGRRPSAAIPEERDLVYAYNCFTNPSSQYATTRRVNKIKNVDKCFKTGIPVKVRPMLNQALNEVGSRPLHDLIADEEIGYGLYQSPRSGKIYKLKGDESFITKLKLIRIGDA